MPHLHIRRIPTFIRKLGIITLLFVYFITSIVCITFGFMCILGPLLVVDSVRYLQMDGNRAKVVARVKVWVVKKMSDIEKAVG